MTLAHYTFTRPRPFPVLVTLCACVLLFSLGVWQIQRLHWKNDLIQRFDAGLAAAPIALGSIPEAELPTHEFAKVTLTGRPLAYAPVYMAARYYNRVLGYQVLVPIALKKDSAVLVNLGWIPSDQRGKIKLPSARLRLDGIVRTMGRKGPFTPDNQPPKNLWFWYDHAALEEFTHLKLLPVVIDRLENKSAPGVKPTPPIGFSASDIHLRNDHLQYAIIWFAVGFSCLVIFITYHLKRRTDA